MCLEIWIEADPSARDTVSAAATKASFNGLQVQVDHTPLWPWAKRRPVRAWISDGSGCACSLLSDNADWEADTWEMRPEIVELLARTLEVLLSEIDNPVTLQALWGGDPAQVDIPASPQLIGEVVRQKGLATNGRYIIAGAG